MTYLLATLALAGPTSTWTHSSGASFQFPDKPDGAAVKQLVMLFWPADSGFAPNLNVQDQTFYGGMPAFWSTSEAQFIQMGMKILSNTPVKVGGRTAMRLEYSGPLNGMQMHWGALAVENGPSSILLATCTATEGQWARIAPLCKQALDSFKVP